MNDNKTSKSAENIKYPIYYRVDTDNKVFKLHNDKSYFYYQVKKYDTGDIAHMYGKRNFTDSAAMFEELAQVSAGAYEITEQEFKSVMASYYSKEIANAQLLKPYYNS